MDEAKQICRSMPGGRLVSIHDSEENNFVASLVPTGQDVWTGGLLVHKTWVWGDGTAWEFDSWRDDSEKQFGFLKIHSDAMWFGETDENSLSGFVCKLDPAWTPPFSTTTVMPKTTEPLSTSKTTGTSIST